MAPLSGSLPARAAPQRSSSAPSLQRPRKAGNAKSKKELEPPRLGEVVERNGSTALTELRRQWALFQRSIHDQGKQQDEAGHLGTQGRDGFRKVLMLRFGSAAAAWRTCMDKSGTGRISFGELCQTCREIGYAGNLRQLWLELDVEGTGFVSLKEIDPQAHKEIEEFRNLCLETYGSSLLAWKELFNPKGLHGVGQADFVAKCQELGFKGDCKRLFYLLRTDASRKELTMLDFDPQTGSALLRADPCAESISFGGGRKAFWPPTPTTSLKPLLGTRSLSASASFVSKGADGTQPQATDSDLDASLMLDPSLVASFGRMQTSGTGSLLSSSQTPTRNSQWSYDVTQIQVQRIRNRQEELLAANIGMKNLADFKNGLVVRYGSLLKGWQQVIDPYGVGKVAFQVFCERLRHLGYHGDSRELWVSLVGVDSLFLRFGDLDPQSEAHLLEFRSKMKEKYGNMLNAWNAFAGGRGMIDEASFAKRCDQAGLSEADAVKVFSMLCPDRNRRFITLKEFDRSAYNAQERSDTEMLTEAGSEDRKNPLELSFDERQDNTFSSKFRKIQITATRANLQNVKLDTAALGLANDGMPAFKAGVNFKYGSLSSFFRHALDTLGRGYVSFEDFCKGLRQYTGYSGDFRALWASLLKPGSRFLTLQDVDPTAHEAVKNFRATLLEKHGTIIDAWRDCLDRRHLGRLDEASFCSACSELGYQGDAAVLFGYLVPRPMRRHIVLTDIDVSAAQAIYRGDDGAFTLVKPVQSVDWSPSAEWSLSPSRPSTSEGRSRKHDAGFSEMDESLEVPDQRPGTAKVEFADFETQRPGTSPSTFGRIGEKATPPPSRPASSVGFGRCRGRRPSNVVLRPTTVRAWGAHLGQTHKLALDKRIQDEKDRCIGEKDLDGFRRLLIERFGSASAAWTSCLDPEALGRVVFGHLCAVIQQVGGFNGGPRALWSELSGDQKGSFTLQDIFPEVFEDLESFRTALLERFPNGVQQAWREGFDEKHALRIDETLFCERCNALELGLSAKLHKRIFKQLLPAKTAGRKLLMEDDFTTLLIGVPVNQRGTAWKADGPTSEVATSAQKWRTVELSPQPQTSELPAVSVEDFKRRLKRSFGSIWAGWAKYLDQQQVGRVPMSEFVRRARAIGMAGNVKNLFRELDTSNQGWITLRDLDAEVGEAVANFFALAEEKFGTMKEAWKAVFNTSGHVGAAEFAKGCSELGYAGSIERLFRILKPESGRNSLFLEDLGIGAKSHGRGALAELREGKDRSISPGGGGHSP